MKMDNSDKNNIDLCFLKSMNCLNNTIHKFLDIPNIATELLYHDYCIILLISCTYKMHE